MRLQGKVALVSGGSAGIGAAVVRRLAAEGAHVAVGDVKDAEAQAVVDSVNATGGSAKFHHLDVTDFARWQEIVADVVANHGRLDILVNNAGIYDRTPMLDISEESWDRMLAVNGKGVFLGAKACVPAMRESGGGSIVNLSSTAGLRGSLATHYGASKGAVRLMSKSMAVQFAKDNIRCNS